MLKENLKKILDCYKKAEKSVTKLDEDYGIRIWDAKNENFYNQYNYIIFSLFQELFGEENRYLIEDYLFEQKDISFDDLYKILNDGKQV